MKTLKLTLCITFISLLLTSCKNETKPEIKTVASESLSKKKLNPDATYAKVEFTVDGMTCAIGCAATIQKKISQMDGVKYAKVDFNNKLAMVEYDNAVVTPNILKKTVTNIDDLYKVNNITTVDAFTLKQ